MRSRSRPSNNSSNPCPESSELSRSSEEIWQSTGKASTLRRTLHTTRRPEIVRHCSRALTLLRWMLSVAVIVRAFHMVVTCANPRLASFVRHPSRSDLEPPAPRSLFTHACSLPRAAGQPALHVLFAIMLALTPASSTPAACPRSLFATLVTSRRGVHERSSCAGVFLFVVFTRETPATLHTVWLEQSRQHLLSKKKTLFTAFTTSASDTFMFMITLSRFTVSSDPSPCNNATADT